jgi:predicted O-methyltransferase YrrM
MDIKTYIESNTSPLDSVLQQIDHNTHTGVLGADMIAGQVQGRFLEMLSRMIKPLLVLEIGAFTGFGTVCLARGLRDSSGARLITLENNDELEDNIRRNLTMAGVAACVELRMGDALHTLQIMPERDFDLIYLDADKERYGEYYPLLIDRLRTGGFLLVDNTLWYGKAADTNFQDKTTKLMRKFNDTVASDTRIECVMLPIRDGITIVRKIQ